MSRLALMTLALCSLLAACAETRAPYGSATATAMPLGLPDAAPASFTETCARAPELCGAPAVQPVVALAPSDAVAAMSTGPSVEIMSVATESASPVTPGAAEGTSAAFDDAKALHLLQTVNSAVNGRMASDMRLLVNPEDDWRPARPTPNGLVGDCKSFAAEKRTRLIAAGFPADRLFYVVVFRQDIGLHALLMAHLGKGDYALDSRQPWVVPWQEAPYLYVLRQDVGNPMRWSNLVASRTTLSTQGGVAPVLLARTETTAANVGAGSR